MNNIIINTDLENSLKNLKSLIDESNQMELSVCLAGFFNSTDLIMTVSEYLSLHLLT